MQQYDLFKVGRFATHIGTGNHVKIPIDRRTLQHEKIDHDQASFMSYDHIPMNEEKEILRRYWAQGYRDRKLRALDASNQAVPIFGQTLASRMSGEN